MFGAVAVLALALGAGTSQAGVGDSLGGGGGSPAADALGGLLDPAPGASGPARPGGDCPRVLRELGVCKPTHGHDSEDDFRPYNGSRGDRRRHPHAHDGEHDHGSGGHRHVRPQNRQATGETLGLTTLEQTIRGTGDPDEGFQTLELGAGEGRIVREDLAEAKPGRAERRRSLFYAGQTTDWQLVDEESPARVEFVDIAANPPFPSSVSAAWRPQEALGVFAVEEAIRQLNAFSGVSPVSHRGGRRASMDMVLMTGDQADNQQLNETGWVLRLLEGGTLDPNSGTDPSTCPLGQQPSGQTADPLLYAGVQDYDDYYEGLQFYDPDEPTGPKYSDWPAYPGLMDRAQVPFEALGLDVPSYVVPGNHDGLAQGNQKAIQPFEQVGVGCVKSLVPAADLTEAIELLDPEYLEGLVGSNPDQVMFVPPDRRRQYVDKLQYKQVFLDGTQPDGHGFSFVDEAELEASNGAASYYAWTPRRGIRMIGIDTICEGGVTGPSSNGNIDDPQFRWLEGELEQASERDQLIVVFGHHPIRSLDCSVPDETPPPCTVEGEFGHDINPGCDVDPRDSQPVHDGADLTELFHRFPHLITYIAGHTHENTLTQFEQAGGGPGDFWGIETASLVDWPPQNRLVELMDNCDGTLSIFGTTLDGAAPATAPPSATSADGMGTADIASVSRTLSYNDPQAGAGTGDGEAEDRNVELLVADPRRDPSACRRADPDDKPDDDDGDRDDDDDRDDDRSPGDQQPPGSGGSTASGADGSLPFTGLVIGGLLIAAIGLLATGRAVAWLVHRRG